MQFHSGWNKYCDILCICTLIRHTLLYKDEQVNSTQPEVRLLASRVKRQVSCDWLTAWVTGRNLGPDSYIFEL